MPSKTKGQISPRLIRLAGGVTSCQAAELLRQAEEIMEVKEVLEDPAASYWLKAALRGAIERDPVDAANDAEFLAKLLRERMLRSLGR